MPFSTAIGRFAASLVFAGLLAASSPVSAEIQKFLQRCQDPAKSTLCAAYRASLTIPDGWVLDKEATGYFNAQMLLPKGVAFDDAPVKIYAVVRYNRNKQPVSDFLPDSIADWKDRAKDAKITRLDDLARAPGKPAFMRHSFAAVSLKEQGFELQAVTADNDKDGNEFVVTITLSANSQAALKDAEPDYFAILSKY